MDWLIQLIKLVLQAMQPTSVSSMPVAPTPLQVTTALIPAVVPTVNAYSITLEQLCAIMPHCPVVKATDYLPHINAAMTEAQINTKLRCAAFLGEVAEESGELRYMEELWGPTEQQLKYEPPNPVATQLGNTQPGDGTLFKGRSPLQITGRYNYTKYGKLLNIDLISHPELVATPEVGFRVACTFWTLNHLNDLADKSDITTITKRINGGLTNQDVRVAYYNKALSVLS